MSFFNNIDDPSTCLNIFGFVVGSIALLVCLFYLSLVVLFSRYFSLFRRSIAFL